MLALLAALLATLSTGINPVPAQAAVQAGEATASLGVAARTPRVYPQSDGRWRKVTFPLTAAGASAARNYVHDRAKCGDAFCAITFDGSGYAVFAFSRCDRFRLEHFHGYFDAHNHGSLTVELLDVNLDRNQWVYGGAPDLVDWEPVYFVRTCSSLRP
ncbi:hypothetical protein AB0G05_29595 [Nonomuraea wenchangensis]